MQIEAGPLPSPEPVEIGLFTLDETPIKFTVRGNQLIVTEEGEVNNYSFKITGDEMLVSGGDLDAPLTFVRQGTGKGLGGRLNQPATGKRTAETPQKETGLVGRWQSSEATVQIKEDGTLILNGASYRYSVKGNMITLASSEGAAQFPPQLAQVARRRLRGADARRFDVQHGDQLRKTPRNVVAAGPVFGEPVVAEIDHAVSAQFGCLGNLWAGHAVAENPAA